jgi:hypothetical protein
MAVCIALTLRCSVAGSADQKRASSCWPLMRAATAMRLATKPLVSAWGSSTQRKEHQPQNKQQRQRQSEAFSCRNTPLM